MKKRGIKNKAWVVRMNQEDFKQVKENRKKSIEEAITESFKILKKYEDYVFHDKDEQIIFGWFAAQDETERLYIKRVQEKGRYCFKLSFRDGAVRTDKQIAESLSSLSHNSNPFEGYDYKTHVKDLIKKQAKKYYSKKLDETLEKFDKKLSKELDMWRFAKIRNPDYDE